MGLFLNTLIFMLITVVSCIDHYVIAFCGDKNSRFSFTFCGMNFLRYVLILEIAFFVNLIWIFGFSVGFVIYLFLFFRLPYGSVLWLSNIPFLVKVNSAKKNLELLIPKQGVFFAWSTCALILVGIAIVNFFVSEFGVYEEFILANIKVILSLAIPIFILGFFARLMFQSWLSKKTIS